MALTVAATDHNGFLSKNTAGRELFSDEDYTESNVFNIPVALSCGDVLKQDNIVCKGGLKAPWKSKMKTNFESNFVAKNKKDHDVVDEGSLEVPSKSKKKTNSNGSSEGNGVAVKDSKEHDVVDEGSLEVLSRSKKKMVSKDSFEGNGVAV